METKRILIIPILLFFLFCSGCVLPDWLNTSAESAKPSDVLFVDDFSAPGSWDTWSDESSIVDYNHGGLRFFINKPDFNYWSRPKKEFSDVTIEVSASKLSGPDDNQFGVICRYKNRDNFYAFLISSDGYYGILKVKEGTYSLISHEQLQYSEAIARGDATNQLRVECIGSNLVLYINEQKVAVATDLDFAKGSLGLMAGTYDEPGVDILFDDFSVIQP